MPLKRTHVYFPEANLEKCDEGILFIDETRTSLARYKLAANTKLIKSKLSEKTPDKMQEYAAYFLTQMLIAMKGEDLLEKQFPQTSLIGCLGFGSFNELMVEIEDGIHAVPNFGSFRILSKGDIQKIMEIKMREVDIGYFYARNWVYRAPEQHLRYKTAPEGTRSSDLYALGLLAFNSFYTKPKKHVFGKDILRVVIAQSRPSNLPDDAVKQEFADVLPSVEKVLLDRSNQDKLPEDYGCNGYVREYGVDAYLEDWVPKPARDLIETMTSFLPGYRKSIDELLRMEFFNKDLLIRVLESMLIRLEIMDKIAEVAPLVRRDLRDVKPIDIITYMVDRLKSGHEDWFDIFHFTVLKKYAADEYNQSVKIIKEAVMPLARGTELPGEIIGLIIKNIKIPLFLPEAYINEIAVQLVDSTRESVNRLKEARANLGMFVADERSKQEQLLSHSVYTPNPAAPV